jgi:shikimate kinase
LRRAAEENLILIGMPGAGKSTIGERLARALSRPFLDTDRLMEERYGCRLQQIIDLEGLEAFCRKEEETILSVRVSGYVIATGGSVVYGAQGMAHLQELGRIVWLDLPLDQLEERLRGGTEERGIVRSREQSLSDLHLRRRPLYERYAHVRVSAVGKTDDEVAREILERLGWKGEGV